MDQVVDQVDKDLTNDNSNPHRYVMVTGCGPTSSIAVVTGQCCLREVRAEEGETSAWRLVVAL